MNSIRPSFALLFAATCGWACAQSSTTSAAPAVVPVPTQQPGIAGQPASATEQQVNPPAVPANMQSAAKALMDRAKSNTKPLDKEQVGNWIESLRVLFEESATAKNIEASGNAEAIALREQARTLRSEAKQAFDGGDIVKPQALLNKAATSFIQGARMLAPKPDPVKLKADLDDRIAQVTSLFETYKRSVGEKPTSAVVDTLHGIERALADATQYSTAGKFTEGRMAVDKALLLTRAASGGEAKDASRDEKYRYALERNETHQMLVRLLLAEKRSAAEVDPSVQGNMEKASTWRGQADTAAERKDYASAIKMLDDSTVELVQAIRKAGGALPR